MSKERLEEIKQILKDMQEYVNLDGSVEDYPRYDEQALRLIDDGHVVWLAERVQELEEVNKTNYGIASDFKFENLVLEQQNKRYREELEFYADGENYDEEMIGSTLINGSKVMCDEGQIAREVLEERSDR